MTTPDSPANRPAGIHPLIKRRRAIPLATTAAAVGFAGGLAGCGMLPSFSGKPDTAAATPAPISQSTQQRTAERVRDFTSNIDVALDQVDRERLRAAAEKKNALAASSTASQSPRTAPAASAGTAAATPPAAAPANLPPASAQSQVLLASSTSEETHASSSAPPQTHGSGGGGVSMAVGTGGHAAAPAILEPGPKTVPPAPIVVEHAPPPAPAPVVAPVVAKPDPVPLAAPTPVQATPMNAKGGADAVITPIAAPQQSTPSAMGSMTALASASTETSAHGSSAASATTPVSAPIAAPAMALDTPVAADASAIDDALSILRKQVAAHPTLNTALALALLDTGNKDAEVAKSLPDLDQKVYSDLLAALQGMNGAATPGPTLADRTAPLLDVAKKWQADADLTLPKLVLATRVDSFGVYNAIESKFEQGRRHTIIIYCEVANFFSKKTDDGWFQTRLSQQETLITDDGLLVWRPNAEEVEDRSLNQRHDFYLVKKLTIPENLASGKYTLRMSVTDRNTNKISVLSLPIEITARN